MQRADLKDAAVEYLTALAKTSKRYKKMPLPALPFTALPVLCEFVSLLSYRYIIFLLYTRAILHCSSCIISSFIKRTWYGTKVAEVVNFLNV